MDFRLSSDQLELAKSAKDFLSKQCSGDAVRRAFESEDGCDKDLYSKIAELGWIGVAVPEEHSGAGLGLVELAVVAEQLGYFNAPVPFFSNACLAVPLLIAAGAHDEAQPVIEGKKNVAVVIDPEFVLDGHLAQAFIVTTDDELYLVDGKDAKVAVHLSLDGTRRAAKVEVAAGAGKSLGSSSVLQRVLDAATVMLSAEMVGGMQWALDTTLEYARVRTQFGRPIGSFQVVKHRLADMLLKTESARSAAYYAAWANQASADDAGYATSVCKAYVSDAAPWVAGECVQLHGGIGFTWEHDAHMYFKRSVTNADLLGDAAFHRERALMLSLSPSR